MFDAVARNWTWKYAMWDALPVDQVQKIIKNIYLILKPVFWRFLAIFVDFLVQKRSMFDAVARQWTWKYAMWEDLSAKAKR